MFLVHLVVGQTHAATGLHPVFRKRRLFAKSVFGHGQQGCALTLSRHGYHSIALAQGDCLDAVCRTGHGTHIVFVNADRHAVPGGNKQPVGTVGETDCGDLVALVQTNGNQAVFAHVLVSRKRCPLDLARTCDHDHILALFEVRGGENGCDLFAL